MRSNPFPFPLSISLALLISFSADSSADVLFSQPPNPAGGLHQSSWWDPDGHDSDWYVWDSFTLAENGTITDIDWRGGYKWGASYGGHVIGFDVSICASIAANTEPDVVNPPLYTFYVPDDAGETPAGTFGGTVMYDYHAALPEPFEALGGVKYWVQIEGYHHGLPEWGFADATGGNGSHYRKTSEYMFQFAPGDCTFSLLGTFHAPPVVTSIEPAVGSEAGGERVTIRGSQFGSLGVTSVAFDGVAATILEIAPGSIRLTSPPGAGAATVEVTTPSGVTSVPSGYVYVAPEIAARFGNVNQGLGDREDVLFVNDDRGDANRILTLARTDPFTVRMSVPSTRATSVFALYGWVGTPGASHVTAQPFGLGNTVFPTPLVPARVPQPRVIWNNAGHPAQLGSATHLSTPAPSIVLVSTRPFGRALTATFQGLVRDGGSVIPQGFSVTNAVVLRLQ